LKTDDISIFHKWKYQILPLSCLSRLESNSLKVAEGVSKKEDSEEYFGKNHIDGAAHSNLVSCFLLSFELYLIK